MMFRQMGRELLLNFLKIAPRHSWADIHPIGMERFEPTLASPEVKDRGIVEESQQKVLVIACQGSDGRRPLAGCKPFDHRLRRTAIDIIAEENRHGMVE